MQSFKQLKYCLLGCFVIRCLYIAVLDPIPTKTLQGSTLLRKSALRREILNETVTISRSLLESLSVSSDHRMDV